MDNIQTAFNTRMPPKSMLLQGEVGRSGGDLGAGKGHRTPGGREGHLDSGRGREAEVGGITDRRSGLWEGHPMGLPVTHAGSSPHPSLTEEEDSQTELLIAEEKLSPTQEGQLMPR